MIIVPVAQLPSLRIAAPVLPVKTYVFARPAVVLDRPAPRVVTASAHLFMGRLAIARLRSKSLVVESEPYPLRH